MKRKYSILLIPVAMILFSSCATIFTGTKDRISFNSTPSGAMVYLDGVELCKTPCSARIKRSLNDKQVDFKLDGYETRVITLDKEFNLVSIINLASILGWGVDLLSGSVMKYDRKAYDITLNKNQKTSMFVPNKIELDSKNKKATIYIIDSK